MRRPALLAALAIGAVVALCGSAALLKTSTQVLEEKYDLPDGVEPEDKLSFTRAVKAHEMSAKKLDDVASRFAGIDDRLLTVVCWRLKEFPQGKFEFILR